MKPLRLLFAGTPEFAAVPLKALLDSGRAPELVLTQPDRPAGRGRKLAASPVKQLAESRQIPVFQPESLGTEAIIDRLRPLQPDLMIVVAYGLILPAGVLAIPRYGCWNIHASLLPRWRGAAPIQRCIEAGDAESGVSIMQMATGLDTGPVHLQVRTGIGADETGGSLHDRLAGIGADALLHCLERLETSGLPAPMAQDESRASYARKLSKSEAQIEWQRPAAELERRIRAFNPWPVCWTPFDGERLRVWRARVMATPADGAPGTRCGDDRHLDFVTGRGVLRLEEVQRPGGTRQEAADFLNAKRSGPAPRG